MAEMAVVRMVTTPQLFNTNNWAVMVLGAFLAYVILSQTGIYVASFLYGEGILSLSFKKISISLSLVSIPHIESSSF